MNPADIQVRLRPRGGWEAVDLGCALVRRFARRVWLAWFVCVLPVQVLLLALLWNHPLLALLLLWWFKPVASRVMLHILARAMFDQRLRLPELLRSLPRLTFGQLPRTLLTQRFSPMRSFNLPLFELEGTLDRTRRRHRLRSLQSLSSCSANFTWTAITIETLLMLGLCLVGWWLVPESIQQTWTDALAELGPEGLLEHGSLGLRRMLAVLLVVTMLLLEPFYVGGGFLLYLNARTILEGWDIELSLRRLQQRLEDIDFTAAPAHTDPIAQPPKPPPSTSPPQPFGTPRGLVPVGLAIAALLALGSPPAEARQPESVDTRNPHLVTEPVAEALSKPQPADPFPRERAGTILERPEFEVFTRRTWVPAESAVEPAPVNETLSQLFQIITYGVLALLLLAGLGWLIHWLCHREWTSVPVTRLGHPRKRVTELAGLDLRSESLPEDLVRAARHAWEKGRQREALALLYRGSLAWLLDCAQLPIQASDTEHDCLDGVAARPDLAAVLPYLRHMTGAWLRCAYAHQPPSEDHFEQLCRDWPFAAATPPPTAET